MKDISVFHNSTQQLSLYYKLSFVVNFTKIYNDANSKGKLDFNFVILKMKIISLFGILTNTPIYT